MKRMVTGLALLIAAAGPAGAEQAASLTIHVENVDVRGGILRLGLYDKAQYDKDDDNPLAAADVTAQPGETIVTLKNLKPGIYAIEVFQDLNGNGKMDFSWLGLPEEPYGFSRDAHPVLSQPSFARAAFLLDPGENLQTLHLQGPVHAKP